MSTRSSYSQPSSGARSRKSSSRSWRRSQSRVCSSGGKIRRRAELGDHVRDRPALGHRERGGAGAGELEHAALAAPHAQAAQQLEDHVLGLHPRAPEVTFEAHLDYLRAGDLERVAAHHDGHVEPARADREHAERAAGRRVRVGADQDVAGPPEALQVHVVAEPVPGAREVHSVAARERAQEAVVVRVLEVERDHVVVDVLDGAVDLHPRHAELLELHERHRAGGVLQ
jgi:hypothetical protein